MSKVPSDPNMSPEVRRFLDGVSRQVDGLTPASVGAADVGQTFAFHGHIKTPAAQDYRIVEYLPFPITITKIYGKTSTGTLSGTFKINSTAITGGAVSATSTQSNVTPTAANVGAIGDALVLTPSSLSSVANFSFSVIYTRDLASS